MLISLTGSTSKNIEFNSLLANNLVNVPVNKKTWQLRFSCL